MEQTHRVRETIRYDSKENRSAKSALEREFEMLSAKWKKETRPHSSLSLIYTHPAYQRIIGMGRDGLPFVLKDLSENPARWFYALKLMAGTDVANGISKFEDARETWLKWGRDHNYI